jgi:hypothetical protein
VISWSQILYGVALTAAGETALTVAVSRWRHPALAGTAVVGAVLAVLGWQAVLHVTHAWEFFTDLPFAPFPVSWQDTGSGVTALAVTALALALAYGPLRRDPAPVAATLAAASGTVALLVDVYLY